MKFFKTSIFLICFSLFTGGVLAEDVTQLVPPLEEFKAMSDAEKKVLFNKFWALSEEDRRAVQIVLNSQGSGEIFFAEYSRLSREVGESAVIQPTEGEFEVKNKGLMAGALVLASMMLALVVFLSSRVDLRRKLLRIFSRRNKSGDDGK